jgi:hypothetical protein
MEQRNFVLRDWVKRLQLVRFVQAAARTLQRQVFSSSWPALTSRDHVVDVEDRTLSELSKAAIAASSFIAGNDRLPKFARDG